LKILQLVGREMWLDQFNNWDVYFISSMFLLLALLQGVDLKQLWEAMEYKRSGLPLVKTSITWHANIRGRKLQRACNHALVSDKHHITSGQWYIPGKWRPPSHRSNHSVLIFEITNSHLLQSSSRSELALLVGAPPRISHYLSQLSPRQVSGAQRSLFFLSWSIVLAWGNGIRAGVLFLVEERDTSWRRSGWRCTRGASYN
jgi:hypothetical protein